MNESKGEMGVDDEQQLHTLPSPLWLRPSPLTPSDSALNRDTSGPADNKHRPAAGTQHNIQFLVMHPRTSYSIVYLHCVVYIYTSGLRFSFSSNFMRA